MIKTVKKIDLERLCLNLVKAIYEKATAEIVLNEENLKAFPLRSKTSKGYSLSPVPFNRVLKTLANARVLKTLAEKKKRNKSNIHRNVTSKYYYFKMT